MLIRDVEIAGKPGAARLHDGRIVAMGPGLVPRPGETVIEGQGAALLPGLRDHHIHLFAAAAALESVDCGPPLDAAGLAMALTQAARDAAGGWVRGVGYHDNVAGRLDRDFLDSCCADTPIRVQHRSGRLWILNSAALDRLGATSDSPLERQDGRFTGRLYDADGWLQSRVRGQRPDLKRLGALLASRGVVGLTDTGHANDLETYGALRGAVERGDLLQDLLVFGGPALDAASAAERIRPGAVKFHLHDNDLPDPEVFTGAIRRAHRAGRAIAVHCVTVADLVITLSCLEAAGPWAGDRIEHGSLIPPDLIDWVAKLGVTIVTQPHFIAERGDDYLCDLPTAEHSWLYPVRSLTQAGIPLAAGSDAPYGRPDPWASMQAAVDRRTPFGRRLGESERLSPEAALGLYTGAADQPGAPTALRVEAPADLVLLDRPWGAARQDLAAVQVAMTLRAGRPIWSAAGAPHHPARQFALG